MRPTKPAHSALDDGAISPEFERPTDTSTHTIDVQSVSKVFATGSGRLLALDRVSVSIGPGEFISFVGPSGCGKSTLLSLVAGLMTPTAGQILLNGARVEEPSRTVGIMFQAPVLLPWRTTEKNVLLPFEVFRADRDKYHSRVRHVLELVGLTEFAAAYPRQLSGGMQQRVALARVLVYGPQVLLMDEPFGALDEFTREAMNLELLRIAAQARVTVLFVTHSINEAIFLSDRVVVMTPRPGRAAGIVRVPFERPREIELMHDPTFADLVFEVRGLLGGGIGH